MIFTLNNRTEIVVHESLTVSGLLALKNYSFKMIIVKINGALVKKEDYPTTNINNGDTVVVLHLMSGG